MISYTAERGTGRNEAADQRICEGLYLQEKANGEHYKLHCEKKNEGFKTASKVQYGYVVVISLIRVQNILSTAGTESNHGL